MNYKAIYEKIILRAKPRGLIKSNLNYYTEEHHIIPRSINGTDEDENLVLLTFREHRLCHILLTRIYPNCQKLFCAAQFMINQRDESGNKIPIPSRLAEEIRRKAIEHLREINTGENNPMFGKKITEEHKKILSIVNSHKKSKETVQKMSIAQRGKHPSKESKDKMSKSHTGLHIHTEEHKEELRKRWTESNPNKGKDMSGANNPSSKPIIGPNGEEYLTVKECARRTGHSVDTIRGWCRNKPEKGFRFKDKL